MRNKRKTLEAAQKYVQKGAFDKALKEYHKLLKADPSDTNIRLKVGDLHVKRGDTALAIQSYSQLAEQFAKAGFDAKAVAIYKQVLRIDEAHIDAIQRLGDLFQRMGLVSDALREFQKGIKICEERDQKAEAFDLLKRVASLDPENIPNRLRLASLFAKQGMKEDAQKEFTSLIEQAVRGGEPETIVRACEQALEVFPDESSMIQQLASAKVDLGEQEVAIELLSEAALRLEQDIPIREALAAAYESVGDSESVKRVFLEIAELCKLRGDTDRAREIVQRFSEGREFADADAPDSEPSIVLSDELQAEADADPMSFDFTTADDEKKPSAAKAKPEIAGKAPEDLLAEARVSFDFGDMAGAEACLNQLLELHPDFEPAHELLTQIRDASATSDVRPELAEAVPGAEDDDFGEDQTLPDIELTLQDVLDQDDQYASVDPPKELQDTELELDLESAPPERESDAAGAATEEPPAPAPPGPASADDTAGIDSGSARIMEELEEAEFFIQQGMLDEAERTCRDVLAKVPKHPTALLRLGEISEARRPADEASTAQAATAPPEPPVLEPEEPILEAEPEPPVLEPEEPILEAEPEAELELDLALGLEPEADPPAEDAEEDFFDLAAELEAEAPAKGQEGIQELFRAFKKEIQEQVAEEDVEAHYDLAIAYKEMGLFDDALEELVIVERSGSVPIKSFASLVAACNLGQGKPADAVKMLERALAEAGDDPECAVSLRYDLGEAFLAADRRSEARDMFRKVASIDASYGDVHSRLSDLEEIG